jgi:PAS domain S-box-containing protein
MNIGNTRLSIGPLRDLGQLDETIERIERIPAVSAVAVEAFVDRRVLLTVHLPSLVDLPQELRAALGGRLLSCAVCEDRLQVVLQDPGAAPGEVVDGTVHEDDEPLPSAAAGHRGTSASGRPAAGALAPGRPSPGRPESPWGRAADNARAAAPSVGAEVVDGGSPQDGVVDDAGSAEDALVIDEEPAEDAVVVDDEPAEDPVVVDEEPAEDAVVVDEGPVGPPEGGPVIDEEPAEDAVVVDDGPAGAPDDDLAVGAGPGTSPVDGAGEPEPQVLAADATRLVLAAVESMEDVSILVFDREIRVRASAGAALARHGRRREDVVGRHASRVHSPAVWEHLAAGYEAALEGLARTIGVETPAPVVAYETTFTPIRERGVVVGGMAVSREVTARRGEPSVLGESAALLEDSFAHAPVATALISTDGRWLRVNRRLCELLGRDEDAIVGSTLQELTHPDDVLVDADLGRETLDGVRDRYAVDKRFVRADGSVAPTRQEVSLVRGPDGAPRWFVVQVVDLSVPARAPSRLASASFWAA